MNVFRLLEFAADRLKTNDALFHEQADTVLGILRSALDLSRFSAAPRARLSHLSFESDRAFPAQC